MSDCPNVEPWLAATERAGEADVRAALACEDPSVREFAILISRAAGAMLEPMAQRAQALTRRHFGRTIGLYAPLYLSNYCDGGCAYCGFAADRDGSRRKLGAEERRVELEALHAMGLEEVLLLTGERGKEAGFEYLLESVVQAAEYFHRVTVEAFAMSREEYARLAGAGCTGVTLYQETYHPETYARMHRWGVKKDYAYRLDAPARALAGGIRTVGLGVLLGLGDSRYDLLALFQHLTALRKRFWQGGFAISFPRLRPEAGGYEPTIPVDDRMLARVIFAFRICLPDVPLVLSTRESPAFRDGMAGVGICRMSVASRTCVGGYTEEAPSTGGQFEVSDTRDVEAFCAALRARGLQPVFKNWDATLRDFAGAPAGP